MRQRVTKRVVVFLMCGAMTGLAYGQEVPAGAPSSQTSVTNEMREVFVAPLHLIHQVIPCILLRL